MSLVAETFNKNVSLLKAKASRHSIIGSMIAVVTVIIATTLSGYTTYGSISLETFVEAQKNNMVLWILDGMPFVFAIWGQYVSSVITYEASAMVIDQTEEMRTHTIAVEKKAAYEATHDSLTGLPNRTLFIDRLEQATSSAARKKENFAVLLLDIDRFKEVNDTLGHYSGDRLIKQIALRLKNVIRESDTLARIGGDDFAFLLRHLKVPEDVENIVRKINQSLSPPFVLENLTLDVQASIGVVIYPEHGRDTDILMQRVDVAMYVAKRKKSGFVIYSEELDEHSPHRLTLSGELREAIQQDELVLYYQPKIVSGSQEPVAVEALVRWQHKKHGLMLPDDFIPLAERTGLIHDLTKWVLRHAMQQCAEWYKTGLELSVSVNISSLSLLDPEFPEILTGLLASHDLPAENLTIEITETSIMLNPEHSLAVLNRINGMGIKISIDDFGTGYSSLAYLKKMPVSEIKIDKLFVMEMLTSESDATIVNATIQLGHNLGLKVVAEGVKDEQIFNELQKMNCDLQQGFFISEPIAADDLYDWFRNRAGNSGVQANQS